MKDINHPFSEEKAFKIKRFSRTTAVLVAVFAFLVFWQGVNFLQNHVFKNYFDPSRHTIVEQDPDTMEIYAWKDAAGNIHTPDDPDVKRFPYAITLLLLAVIGISAKSHDLLVRRYHRLLMSEGGKAGLYPQEKGHALPGRILTRHS
ncbi:hypothetical protein [Desulfovirgula thermocuniculi]|uniref:hypothetical protein n=1 Tax=Desulfovirgula thermocuniculi TaxID=348842 RepID=UPI00068595F9|nr:hypothetical protein [Desulfovirgula thermocuniculi]